MHDYRYTRPAAAPGGPGGGTSFKLMIGYQARNFITGGFTEVPFERQPRNFRPHHEGAAVPLEGEVTSDGARGSPGRRQMNQSESVSELKFDIFFCFGEKTSIVSVRRCCLPLSHSSSMLASTFASRSVHEI